MREHTTPIAMFICGALLLLLNKPLVEGSRRWNQKVWGKTPSADAGPQRLALMVIGGLLLVLSLWLFFR